jgi:hypothetical protein
MRGSGLAGICLARNDLLPCREGIAGYRWPRGFIATGGREPESQAKWRNGRAAADWISSTLAWSPA